MLKRHHRFFQSLLVGRDAALVGIAFSSAFFLRFFSPVWSDGSFNPRETLQVGLLAVLLWTAVAWVGGLYVSQRTRSVTTEIFGVARATLVAFLVVVTVSYFLLEVRFSRATLLLWALFAFALVSLARVGSRVALRRLRAHGFNLRHVLVVGIGDVAEQVLTTVQQQAHLGLRVAGIVLPPGEAQQGKTLFGVPVLGVASDLSAILQSGGIDQVIVALPSDKLPTLRSLMRTLSRETVDVHLVPDLYQYATLSASVDEFGGLPIINLQATPLLGWNRVLKRGFDVAFALVGLLLIGPVMLLLALLVKFSSPGPIFFRQERVGMDGRKFYMFKFRTMRVGSDDAAAGWTVANDPRRTVIGGFLRRWSLDELPQFLNVVRGEMSLVGPRPEQPAFIEGFKTQIPRYALRHKMKAGITGWAQVNGLRGDTSIAKRIEHDLYYIENWSIALDIKILMRTIFGGFISPNAY